MAMKLTNGLSTTCYRVTTESFLAIAGLGGFEIDEPLADLEGDLDELADTGFDQSHWLVIALLLLAMGATLVVYARRRA